MLICNLHGRSMSGIGMRSSAYRLFAASGLAIAALAVASCGSLRGDSAPAALAKLNSCLKKHGVAHPEDVVPPSAAELAVPQLIGVRGLSVPTGVTRSQFQGALRYCGADKIHVNPAPIIRPAVQKRVSELWLCLSNNGFTLPAPNFKGPGTVFDTSRINVTSASWIATVRGCGITRQLTKPALIKCMGLELTREARGDPAFERRFQHLAHCLTRLRSGSLGVPIASDKPKSQRPTSAREGEKTTNARQAW